MYKNYPKMLPCLFFLSTSTILGCATLASSSPDTNHPRIIANVSKNDRSKDSTSKPDPYSVQVAGSKSPSRWVYGKSKSVACRINKWSALPLETRMDFEFKNLTSKKPINVVYTIFAKDSNGNPARYINMYTDKQTDITRFNPLLKKGETRKFNFLMKHFSPSFLELKECRIAQKNEDFWTINPEMKDYVGP
jgi:hypothetical protein